MQVSVAVLLDSFISASLRIEEEEATVKLEERRRLQQVRSRQDVLVLCLQVCRLADYKVQSGLKQARPCLHLQHAGSHTCELLCVSPEIDSRG